MLEAMFSVIKWSRELQNLKPRVIVVLAGSIDINLFEYINQSDIIIAVDGGCNSLLDANITPDYLIGDLDSVTNIPDCQVIEFDPVKDDSDFICSLKFIEENIGECTINVLGYASINRVDHVLANISAINNNVQLISSNQLIYVISNTTEIEKGDYKYISFFSYREIKRLTLIGFKYPLTNYNLHPFDPLCISNEIIHKTGIVKISNDRLLVIQSKES